MEYWKFIILFFSPLIGGLLIFVVNNQTFPLKLILSFSGAYLFSITMLHLLPEVYIHAQHHAGLFILLGFVFQVLLEHFSQGIEHGHIHKHHHSFLPIGMLISLSLHAFLEGVPISDIFSNKLVWGIALHHIPVAFTLASTLLGTHLTKTKTIAIVILFALMSPLGYTAGLLLKGALKNDLVSYFSIIMAIVIGMFLHISTTILFEASDHHKFGIKKLVAITLGISIALVNYVLGSH